MRDITLVMPYFENPTMFQEQQRVWSKYPAAIREHLHVIVGDDGSPTHPAAPHVIETGVASFRLYRIIPDIRWNWLAVRNLAMSEASTHWALMTDIDHVVPEKTWRALMADPLDETAVYRFSRVDAPNLTPYKPHPNSWFLTRAMFDRIGGYDERFSGFYGTDSEFRDRVYQTARRVILRSDVLIRYPRDVIPDASTTVYDRKTPRDRENVARIRKERDKVRGWTTKRLTFPWERLV